MTNTTNLVVALAKRLKNIAKGQPGVLDFEVAEAIVAAQAIPVLRQLPTGGYGVEILFPNGYTADIVCSKAVMEDEDNRNSRPFHVLVNADDGEYWGDFYSTSDGIAEDIPDIASK